MADEDAHTDGAGAGFFEGLDLAEADAGGELVALVDDGFGVCGAGLKGAGEDIGGELGEVSDGGDFCWQGLSSLGGGSRRSTTPRMNFATDSCVRS
jgi:hypothetical protein